MGGLGCDNMTTIVAGFIEGRDYRTLAQVCSTPVFFNFMDPLPTADLIMSA